MSIKEVNKKLQMYGIDPLEDTNSKTSSYLMGTLDFFKGVETQKLEAIKLYKSNKFNVKTLAEYLNVERQTIYNYPVLKKLIKSLQQEIQDKDVFNNVNVHLEKIEAKDMELQLLYQRDVQIEELKYEIDSLKEQLLAREIEYNNLEIEYQSNLLNKYKKDNKILSMAKHLED